jgi:hypothetical protein
MNKFYNRKITMNNKNNQMFPAYKEGFTTLQIKNQDLLSLIMLLNTAKIFWTKLAMIASNEGNSVDTENYTVQAQTCKLFVDVLSSQLSVGEPVSRDIH